MSNEKRTKESGGSATTASPVTPSLATEEPSGQPMGEPGMNDEERLDEALQETLPTSDPISIHIE